MRSSELEDDQAELVNGSAAEMTTDGEEVVKKAKKKKSVGQSNPQTATWFFFPVCAPKTEEGDLHTLQEAEGG